MATLTVEMQCDDVVKTEADEAAGYAYGGATVRISNDAAENGYDQEPGPLTWLNSARLVADPDDDAVHCYISVGDPRGAFGFTVRRLSDGTLVIHTPYPEEGLSHMETKHSHPGTLSVVGDFSDTEPEDEDGD